VELARGTRDGRSVNAGSLSLRGQSRETRGLGFRHDPASRRRDRIFSQPVLYSPCSKIAMRSSERVALEGFGELAVMLRAAIQPSSTRRSW